MKPALCEHLQPVQGYLRSQSVAVEGPIKDSWYSYFRTVMRVDVVLDGPALRKKLKLSRTVRKYDEFDIKTGGEYGFYCEEHKDALIGIHPRFSSGKKKIS